ANSGTDVTFNSNIVSFNDLGSIAPGVYTLFTFDQINAYTGTLAIGSGLASYSGSTFVYNPNNIQLVVAPIPEPSAWGLLIGAFGIGIFFRNRKRNNNNRPLYAFDF
ncbi:MAG: PEP-CTERM sorting domain-containing protein, partial [Verrucomicrobiota bacterium]